MDLALSASELSFKAYVHLVGTLVGTMPKIKNPKPLLCNDLGFL